MYSTYFVKVVKERGGVGQKLDMIEHLLLGVTPSDTSGLEEDIQQAVALLDSARTQLAAFFELQERTNAQTQKTLDVCEQMLGGNYE